MADASQIKASRKVFGAAFAALLGALSLGLHLGFTSPAFDDMKNREEIIPKDNGESVESWIGSSLAIGALVGGILVQFANNIFGRRWSLIASGAPMIFSWLFIALAQSSGLVIFGRLLAGLCCGILCGVAPTYVVEISPPSIRGTLGTCFQVMITIGILMETVVITFMNWRWMAGINVVFAILMSGLMLIMPETPQWFLSKQRNEEAESSLKQFRKGSIATEFNTFVQSAQEIQNQQQIRRQTTGELITSVKFYKPLTYSLALMFFQQFSGVNAILFYQTAIYKESVPSLDATTMTIIVCFAQVVATIIGSFLVDKLGRRALLITSGLGHTISLLVFGFYNYAGQEFKDANAWLALLSLIIFISSFSIGFGPIPWMMVPEMSGSEVRSLIASISTFFNWVFVFIVAISMKPMLNSLGKPLTYWLFAFICALSCIFVAVFLPETKGKTNDQIQREILGLPEPTAEEIASRQDNMGNKSLKALA